MDARQLRSRNALATAIIDLAKERAVDSLTVSEVAERAGVHRSTFYEHAASPMELLQSVLNGELDEIRERHLAGAVETDVAPAVTAVTADVLQHVDRYDSIYIRGLGADSGSGSLHSMLSEHFRESSRRLQQLDAFSVPLKIDGLSIEVVKESVAAYVAGGAVGAIEVWLTTPQPRKPAAFLDLWAALVPTWWPLVGNVSAASER